MSFRVRDIYAINKNQLNHSTSKQQYSFTKQKRFSESKKNQTYHFYELPSTNLKKAGKFSSSERKLPFQNKEQLQRPSPDKYNPREIKITQEMISFPAGREQCAINSFLRVVKNPGPGTYNPQCSYTMNTTGSKYSICGKPRDEKIPTANFPGPGFYHSKNWIQNSRILSTEKNAGCPLIRDSNKSNRILQVGEHLDLPIYNPEKNNRGRDRFNRTGASFNRSLRFRQRIKTEVPGPGSYNRFSEFI